MFKFIAFFHSAFKPLFITSDLQDNTNSMSTNANHEKENGALPDSDEMSQKKEIQRKEEETALARAQLAALKTEHENMEKLLAAEKGTTDKLRVELQKRDDQLKKYKDLGKFYKDFCSEVARAPFLIED
mmetsp:Transcript_37796/g.90419  ORF Transcript_37796/g.90419 Transcript_37796/m.90419 type:complete len:129 (+) Transcript_37796:167-553(+)